MKKTVLVPLISGLFMVACGTAKTGDNVGDLDTLLGTKYEDQSASADVDEGKFDAYLVDGYNESSFGLAETVVTSSSSVVVTSSPGAATGATGAAGPSAAKLEPAKRAEFEKRAKQIREVREAREEREHDRIPSEKMRPKEKEKPAFRIALQESRQYVMALVGVEKSPFDNFRAALIDAKSKAKSEEEYKTLVDAASKTFVDEKVAVWKLIETGVAANKVEIDGIRAERKKVVAACVVEKDRGEGRKPDEGKPADLAKAAPTAEEIAARKLAREAERKDEMADKDAKKAKAESAECVAATAALKALIQ
jgi:hypothetical protein